LLWWFENAGFGATWAAPISSLLMEQYLNGKIARTEMYDHIIMSTTNSDVKKRCIKLRTRLDNCRLFCASGLYGLDKHLRCNYDFDKPSILDWISVPVSSLCGY
jgi:hypothetical protein